LVENVRDMVINFDLTNIQFEPEKMYEEAKKIGMDVGDLEDYGFDIKGKCGNGICIDRQKIKSFADFVEQTNKMGAQFMEKGKTLMNRAQCHPTIKEHVMPRVEIFWWFFPLNWVFGICGGVVDLILCPCCWCIQLPLYAYTALPWNFAT